MFVISPKVALPALLSLALLGCSREGELTSLGVITTRSACPTVAIPAGTGDITLFNPATSRDASAIDVVASITDVTSTCDETGEYIVSNVNFVVHAQRRDPRGAREVTLPYFTAVVQGGSNVVSKRLGRVGLRFAEGEYRASTTGAATGCCAPPPRCPRRPAARSRASASPATPTRRSIRWPIRRCARRCSGRASNCSSASS